MLCRYCRTARRLYPCAHGCSVSLPPTSSIGGY
jgi:hypothetical protein